MESNLKINITYPDTELKEALKFYILNIFGFKKYALISYPIIFTIIAISINFNNYLIATVYFILGLVLFIFYYTRPISSYLNFYKTRKGGEYEFSDENIKITATEIQSTTKWSVFTKAYEIPNAFLLIDRNKFVYIYLKSCFDDVTQIDKMNTILTSKFSDYKSYNK